MYDGRGQTWLLQTQVIQGTRTGGSTKMVLQYSPNPARPSKLWTALPPWLPPGASLFTEYPNLAWSRIQDCLTGRLNISPDAQNIFCGTSPRLRAHCQSRKFPLTLYFCFVPVTQEKRSRPWRRLGASPRLGMKFVYCSLGSSRAAEIKTRVKGITINIQLPWNIFVRWVWSSGVCASVYTCASVQVCVSWGGGGGCTFAELEECVEASCVQALFDEHANTNAFVRGFERLIQNRKSCCLLLPPLHDVVYTPLWPCTMPKKHQVLS